MLSENRKAHWLATLLLVPAVGLAAQPLALDPVPSPEDHGKLESQLKRYRGQTQFLNAAYSRGAHKGGEKAAQRPGKAGDSREQQEADVFKIGKPGSKLLYLLNHYRGLQVVSYEDGPESPKLVGRVDPTGNYPTRMYRDPKQDRLIVLENTWRTGAADGSNSSGSRLLVYSTQDAAAPAITASLPMEGRIADSRMVGDILYVATTGDGKGRIHSFRLAGDTVLEVEQMALTLPVSRAENMNIEEVREGDRTRYYLIAVLSESGWGWWDRKSQVEVVDISDSAGRIKPVMNVSAKGVVRERSQTHIKDGTLLVASNYFTGEARPGFPDGIARIAVETFTFPDAKPEVISEEEAKYRQLHIERAMKKSTTPDATWEKLIDDAEVGLRKRFIMSSDGKLRKAVADHSITVGDTSGLSANLQDVRWEGDLLYTFWVPQTQVDPFDLFDISEPRKGIRYLKRLYFDGWIERAVPLTYKNRRFILGLGWMIENVNNETGRRIPQVRLFEVVKKDGRYRSIDVSELLLEDKRFWSDFKSPDRYIEVRQNDNGTGVVMFQVSSYSNGVWSSGGKLVSFDLEKVIQDKPSSALREGALLSGESGWLRRMFTNSEIQRINSFSDEALSTFDVPDLFTAEGIVRAVHTLELARDIRAYLTLAAPAAEPTDSRFGVQIISADYWSGKGNTTLRLVPTDRADSEKHQVLDELELGGSYSDHLLVDRSRLLVATRRFDGQEWHPTIHQVSLSTPAAKPSFHALNRIQLAPGTGYSEVQLIQMGNEVLASHGAALYGIKGGEASQISLENCGGTGESDERQLRLQIMNERLYLLEEQYLPQEREGVQYARNFFAPLDLKGASAICGRKVNIPGTPVALLDGARLVTDDSKFLDVIESRWSSGQPGEKEHVWYSLETVDSLSSLVLDGTEARLVDYYEFGQNYPGTYQAIGKDRFGYLVNSHHFISIGVDQEAFFTKETFRMKHELPDHSSLIEVIADPRQEDAYYGLISNGRELQVYSWSDQSRRPELLKLRSVNSRFHRGSAVDSLPLQGWYFSYAGKGGYWGGSYISGRGVERPRVNFTPGQGSMEFANGLFGVVQFYLDGPAKPAPM